MRERIGLQYVLPSQEMFDAARQANIYTRESRKAHVRIDRLSDVAGYVSRLSNCDEYGFTANFHQSGGKAIRRALVYFDADNTLIFWPKEDRKMADRALIAIGKEESDLIIDPADSKFYEVDMTQVDPSAPFLKFPAREAEEEELDGIYNVAHQARKDVVKGKVPAKQLDVVSASRIIGTVSGLRVVIL